MSYLFHLVFSYSNMVLKPSSSTLSIHSGRVANTLARDARGDGFTPHLRQYFRDLFLESIQSSELMDLKWFVCMGLQESTVTCDVSGDNG